MKNPSQYLCSQNVNTNLKRAESILVRTGAITYYPKVGWTTDNIIKQIYRVLISVLQNDGIALTILDQDKETIKMK